MSDEMPQIEVGDWVRAVSRRDELVHVTRQSMADLFNEHSRQNIPDAWRVAEVRKANGTVWRRAAQS